jgi:hypothetical protein
MEAKTLGVMLIASAAVVAFGGWPLCSAADEARPATRPAAKADRLTIATASGPYYATVETRLPGTSILCRLPIEIGIPNMSIFHPSSCN